MTIVSRPLSPCIQHCQLDPANTCQGCGRTLDEIAYWSQMTEAEKAPVWERLEAKGYIASRG
ncbi:MAG: DUF1289 domain-containing protein [Halomonadaceae bacterium]|uniref:DUF1289 domain-containing protein n=1 Tax=Halomonas colorata TaxID=2742615 RepID=A0ABR9FUW3_9GAMM|nr:DUF1289 domain-containing protein [Halomonas colorata]MBE0462397.1 DUF1289 domain-containing protein [Halomonas colorata]